MNIQRCGHGTQYHQRIWQDDVVGHQVHYSNSLLPLLAYLLRFSMAAPNFTAGLSLHFLRFSGAQVMRCLNLVVKLLEVAQVGVF